MFREDFEFNDAAVPSHLAASHPVASEPVSIESAPVAPLPAGAPKWHSDAEKELSRIPFFVRGKARRNTERFAEDHGVATITIETLYDAKAHFSR